MPSHWIVVASLDHVRQGVAGGYIQACHGKSPPLGRMRPGDSVACYAPSSTYSGGDTLQVFAAIGVVADGARYQVETDGAFRPYRRDILWRPEVTLAPIRPLISALELTAGRSNWGYAFRYGLIRISPRDAALIARAMVPAGIAA